MKNMSTNLFDLTGKIALVTGASRGIGESIAKLLAEQGAHTIVSSRKAQDCDKVVAQIQAAGGSAARAQQHKQAERNQRRWALWCTTWSIITGREGSAHRRPRGSKQWA